tara:strand:- start:150 stop:479 length:330 start_codon:yes stop_codon:yes gene_type:complete
MIHKNRRGRTRDKIRIKKLNMDKNSYKEIVSQQSIEISELKERIKELETELYFVTRNNKIEQLVDEKQMDLFDSYARRKQTSIFESPDGGKTVYERKIGQDPSERKRIK